MISRNTSFTYKGKTQDARSVGHELSVRYVLEGSVRHVGEHIRVNAQLVEAETGAQIWSERFDLAVKDAYTLQDQIDRSYRPGSQCRAEGSGQPTGCAR